MGRLAYSIGARNTAGSKITSLFLEMQVGQDLAATGTGGSFDAARPRLYIISSAGEVIREFDVSAPVPGLTATNMGIAGDDSVFISFGRVQGGSTGGADSDGPYNLISVMSPQTGEVRPVYRLKGEADAFDRPACAASTNNFLFVGATSDNKHQQVTRYLAR